MKKLLAVGYLDNKLGILDVTDIDFSAVPVEVEALVVHQETLIDRCALCDYDCHKDVITRMVNRK